MCLVSRLIYSLIFQFIVAPNAVFGHNNVQTFDFTLPNVLMPQTTNAHRAIDTSQDRKLRLIESMESMNDERTVCLICHAVGCVKSDNNPLLNSVSTLSHYQKGESRNDHEFISDHEQNHHSGHDYAGSRSETVDMQTDIEQTQDEERQQQEPERKQEHEQHPHAIANIINDETMNSDHDHDNGDVDNDDDCLIGCGNNQTSSKCKALYHKKCLLKWIETSKQDLCLICNQKLAQAQTLSQQCTGQLKTQSIRVNHTERQQIIHWKYVCRKCERCTNVIFFFMSVLCCLAVFGMLMYGIIDSIAHNHN